MHGRPAPQEVGEPRESHPQRWQILGVLLLALVVTSIDHTVINVALPRLVDDLHSTASQLQWIVAAYTIVFAGLLLTAGSLGDRFGRRRALLAGLTAFLGGSVFAGLSTSTTMLIAARGVMGVGGALIMPTTLSILVNAFGSPRERAKAIAAWTAASGAGIALGPIVGGALMRSFSWSSVFWINVPLLAVALVGALHVIPESKDPHATRLDPIGALLSIAGVGTIVYAIIEGPSSGWTSNITLAAFAVGLLVTAAFIGWEVRREEPMLDLSLFRNPAFTAASVALAMLFFAMAGAVFLQAQYLQFILQYSPLVAGCALVPAAIGMMVGTGAGSHLAGLFGGRVAVASGTLLAAGGLAVQAGFVDGTSYLPTGLGLLLFGLGAGMAMPSATDLIMATLPPARAGVGSAVNDTVRELGGALGVAIIGSVSATRYTSSLRSDLRQVGGLSASTRTALADNVGSTLASSQRLGASGRDIAALGRQAFVDSMTTALWIAVGMAVAATVIAAINLPRHRPTGAPGDNGHGHGHLHGGGHGGRGSHQPGSDRQPVHARRVAERSGAAVVGLAILTSGCSTATESAVAPASTRQAPTSTTILPRPSGPVDELTEVDGARLHIQCAGSGDTTVVLIPGFGATGDVWSAVMPAVATRERVCTYTRFGEGTSDPAPAPQTFATEAKDLRAALSSMDESGPFVLAGHSFGGAEAVTFAHLFPADVAGLALIDASPASWLSASCAVPDDGSQTSHIFRDNCASISSGDNPERLDGPSAFGDVGMIESLGSLPMAVVTAARHTYPDLAPAEEDRLNQVWDQGQQHWMSLSTEAMLVPVENTSHNIHVDRPDVVIEQIEQLLP